MYKKRKKQSMRNEVETRKRKMDGNATIVGVSCRTSFLHAHRRAKDTRACATLLSCLTYTTFSFRRFLGTWRNTRVWSRITHPRNRKKLRLPMLAMVTSCHLYGRKLEKSENTFEKTFIDPHDVRVWQVIFLSNIIYLNSVLQTRCDLQIS